MPLVPYRRVLSGQAWPTRAARRHPAPAGAALLAWALVAAAPAAQADRVGFEQTPAGTAPADNTALDAPYAIAGGGTVRFYFDANGNGAFDAGTDLLPVFERTGQADGQHGFYNFAQQLYDTPQPGFEPRLGAYFLRQPVGLGALTAPFIADYDTAQAITALSGEVWDIDGVDAATNERWQVEVLDAAGTVLASQLSPDGTAQTGGFDAAPWTFSFTQLPAGVDRVRLTYVGRKADGIGLAFDNFSPTTAAVPEPGTTALLLAGLVGWALRAGWRRGRRPGPGPLSPLKAAPGSAPSAPRTVLPALAAAAALLAPVPAAQALVKGFDDTSLFNLLQAGRSVGPDVVALSRQMGGAVIVDWDTCTGRMLTPQILLTAAHCFAKDADDLARNYDSRGLPGGAVYAQAYHGSLYDRRTYVAQGDSGLFAGTDVLTNAHDSPGSGAEAFGQVRGIVLQPYWAGAPAGDGFPDLALAIVGEAPGSAVGAGFTAGISSLMGAGSTLQTVDWRPGSGGPPGLFTFKVGASYGDGSATSMARLGAYAVMDASNRPVLVPDDPAGRLFWIERQSDVQSAARMPGLDPVTGQPAEVPNTAFRGQYARIIKGDSGGPLFALTTDPLRPFVQIGVAEGEACPTPAVGGAPAEADCLPLWMPVDENTPFIQQALAYLTAELASPPGSDPDHPLLADAEPVRTQAGGLALTTRSFRFTALDGPTWLGLVAAGAGEIRLAGGFTVTGLHFDGAVPADLRLWALDGAGLPRALGLTVTADGVLAFDTPQGAFGWEGALAQDGFGPSVLGLAFGVAAAGQALALDWTSTTAVPEPARAGLLALGLAALAGLGSARRSPRVPGIT